jgi:hypothetical protein
MDPTDEDAARLLLPGGQWTEPWGSSRDGAPCDKCDGGGRTDHRCWSCVLERPRERCPACAGRVAWEDDCPVCRGSGSVDGAPRHGVSVFPAVAGLYHYMQRRDADLERCVVVELEGERAHDVDFDADEGAVLVLPTAVLGCAPPDHELTARMRALASEVTTAATRERRA